MKTNYHSHTTRCKHAVGEDEAYVLSAIKAGYDEIGFADHSPWPFEDSFISGIRMLDSDLEAYVYSVRQLREKYKNQISIRIGLECEYFEEYLPWLDEIVERYQLDYLIFGNHFPFPKEETDSTYFGTGVKTKKELALYLEKAIKGMESGRFVYMAHPDLFTRCYPVFDNYCASVSRQICEKAKALGIPLEYNVSGYKYNEDFGVNGYPNQNFWTIAAKVGCDVIIGLDAHNNLVYENEKLRERAEKEIKDLGLRLIDSLSFKN